MKVYLVGGAVRDQLLGYVVKERDWVVVGSSPEEMQRLGYQQVGRDFPVFLHPQSREEYALARKERKTAEGYYGFECQFDSNISLEEDLARRDLTINAMAQDENGNLIDPFNGLSDLHQKCLRHVSEAFIEDPVRVLRVARFASRYHHLGFKLAEETRVLMYTMVKKGELNHLVPERIWQEMRQSLDEKNPEIFIKTLRDCDALRVIFPEINNLFGVPNPPKYHPEIDSGIHTLEVLQMAVKLSEDPLIRFAALVHDLGKGQSPMAEWAHHYGHDKKGVKLIEELCKRLRAPAEFRNFAKLVSEYHLVIHRLAELRPATVVSLLEKTDAFRRPQQFKNFLIVCESDTKGHQPDLEYHRSQQWLDLLKICTDVPIHTIIEEGYEGLAIKQELHKRRVAEVIKLMNSWKLHEK